MTTLTLNADATPAERRYNAYVTAVYTPHVAALMRAMLAGKISMDEAEIALAQELDYLIYTAFRAGNDGNDLSDADMGLVRRKIAEQHEFLHDWFDELRAKRDARDTAVAVGVIGASAAVALTDLFRLPVLLARAAFYAKTAASFVAVAQTLALGMPLLPAYPRDGSTECLMNCVCVWIIKKVGPRDWDCKWGIQSIEHCPQCTARSYTWNQLRIRDGVIQPYDSSGLFA